MLIGRSLCKVEFMVIKRASDIRDKTCPYEDRLLITLLYIREIRLFVQFVIIPFKKHYLIIYNL